MLANQNHPLDALPAKVAGGIEGTIGLALDGSLSMSTAIATTRRVVDGMVEAGNLTRDEADAIIDYARSF